MRQSENISKIKEASESELEQMLVAERKNIFDCRQKLAFKQLDNPHTLSGEKKNVARILGEMKLREINKGKGS